MIGTESAIRDSLRAMDAKANVSVLPCRIVKVHKENLTADVYVQETSGTVLNVPICFPSKAALFSTPIEVFDRTTTTNLYTFRTCPTLH